MQWEAWQSCFARDFLEGISLIKRKRVFSILLGCLLAFGLLMQTGCDESTEQELTEICFWHSYTDNQQAVFQMLTDTYNSTEGKKRGVRVVLVYKTPAEIESELTAAFDTGEEYDYPEISIVTSELAYQAMCRSLIVNAEEYLSGAELAGYFIDFLNEGRFTGKEETYIFPISKTSDITIVNDSMWRYFYDDNNVDIQQWLTWEGITSLAEQYYEWSGGRAMVALESVQDYIFTYSAQQLPAIVQAANHEIKINTNRDMLRKIWDFYYGGVVRGYILQTDDICQALADGDIMGYVGTPRDSSYFPRQFRNNTGGLSTLLLSSMSYPSVNASRNIAPQKGNGASVFDHGDQINRECYYFLHWLCSSESIVGFSAENSEISSYAEIYEEPVTKDYMKKLLLYDSVKYGMLTVSIDQTLHGSTYAPTGFIGYNSFCEELTASLVDAAAQGRAEVVALCEEGVPYESAVERTDRSAAFEAWYQSVVNLASKY